MSTAFTALLPNVLPYVRGCADIVAETAIRNTVIDFCSRTLLWQVDSDPQDLVVGEPEYTADILPQSSIVRIMSVTVGGEPITPTTYDILDRKHTEWRTKQGHPTHFVQDRYNTIRLVYTPDKAASAALVIRAALKPTRTSSTFDDDIADRWYDVICAGARARLMSLANEPFSNPQQALIEQREYAAGITKAKIESNKRLARTELRVGFNRNGV